MEDAGRWPPAEFYHWLLLAVFGSVFSAAALVAAVFLFAFCVPTVSGGQTVGCAAPYQSAGAGAFLVGITLLALALYASEQAITTLAPKRAVLPVGHAAGTPRSPDTPLGATPWDRLRRGLAPRSWVDDYPAIDELPPADTPHRPDTPSKAP